MIFVNAITQYSLITALICFNIGLIILVVLYRQNRFLINNSTSILVFLLLLCIIRLFLPLVHRRINNEFIR